MQVTSSGSPAYISKIYTVKEAGYVYLYISNENATIVDVYFDDVTMSYTPGNVVQYNEYYPFGMQTVNSWTRENAIGNNFLGNGGTELNITSSLYDLHYRNPGAMRIVTGQGGEMWFTPDHYKTFIPIGK